MLIELNRTGGWFVSCRAAVRGTVYRDTSKCCAFVFLPDTMPEEDMKRIARPLLELEFALGRWYEVTPDGPGFDGAQLCRYGWRPEWVREPLEVRENEPPPKWADNPLCRPTPHTARPDW